MNPSHAWARYGLIRSENTGAPSKIEAGRGRSASCRHGEGRGYDLRLTSRSRPARHAE